MIKYLLAVFILIPFFSNAQTESSIRDHYQDVNKRIAESKTEGMEGPLYCNEWISNKNSRSWPAVGIFQETTDFWYDDDPNHLPASERDPKTVPPKVMVSRRSASLQTNEEYLYKDGKLVFYYSNETEEGKQWETRIWFNAKGMFKSSVKVNGNELKAEDLSSAEYKDLKPNSANTLKAGKKYQDLFLKDMVY